MLFKPFSVFNVPVGIWLPRSFQLFNFTYRFHRKYLVLFGSGRATACDVLCGTLRITISTRATPLAAKISTNARISSNNASIMICLLQTQQMTKVEMLCRAQRRSQIPDAVVVLI